MKCLSLHMGEVLVIGDATIMLAERRNGGHHARLLVDGPDTLRFELRKPSGAVIPRRADPISPIDGAQDAHPRAFARA
ncbi:hypothetical protein [Xanthobacter agilis]|jgi:hypothetical protein|uniref:Uncharacterized protein n=1 Tax=Xanthobacter agilis TaxID=47492 RepID=A0ABU0LH12_XANAG|nr:hypothetical protein [Xanthobacter agilis]MDQ0506418.1 hypothetical protein [Xanthobacter agilis]